MPGPDTAVPGWAIVDPVGPRALFGSGVVESELLTELDRLRAQRVMLVATDRARAEHRSEVAVLAERRVADVTSVRQHTSVTAARSAADLARSAEVDAVVSLGGGAATGIAKAVAVETGIPVVAVPTTYAGSEATPVYGLTDSGVKITRRSPRALPRTVLYDSTLGIGLPKELTVSSAVNALAHCVAGLFSTVANPVTDALAAGGIRAIASGLTGTRADPSDLRSREQLAYGAYFGGTTLAHAGSGLHHALCHVLGGAYDLPHAAMHAALLPHTLRYLQKQHPDAASTITTALGATCHDAATVVQHLLDTAGGVPGLAALGLLAAELESAANLLAARLTEPPSHDELLVILRAAH